MVDGITYKGQNIKQIDTLKDVGTLVDNSTHRYWNMQNGYAMPVDSTSISNLARRLTSDPSLIKRAEDALRVGVHWKTSVKAPYKNIVCQVYASALPCGYAMTPLPDWEPFARLVLRASYNATLSVATALTVGGTKRIKCYLTFLGGSAFKNDKEWISDAIRGALDMYRSYPIDVVLVHYETVDTYFTNRLAEIEIETIEEQLERIIAENALREGKVFIAYPTQISGYSPGLQVAEARPHQKEAYKIFRKFITEEITESVTETVDDMEIKASIGPGRGYVQFVIKKNFEQRPYVFRITPFSDRSLDEEKYSLFCDLIDETGQISYLSNNESLLKKLVRYKTLLY
jgi:hypothetical protein